MPLPGVIIVGAMKAGTTSLAAWLRAHPHVHMTAQKELHFFDAQWNRGVAWYRSHFDGAPPGKVVGEATPAYMVHPMFIERMASVVPDAKLLVTLRDPVERAWSQYNHSVERGDERRSFSEIIDVEMAADPNDWRTSGMCLARGRYVEQLRNLHAYFDDSQIHTGRFDDLVGNPHGYFNEVCRFLRVDDGVSPTVVGQVFNPRTRDPNAVAPPPRHRRLAELIPRRSRREPAVAEPTSSRQTRSENGTMPTHVRLRLVDYFRPYNEALASEFGIDVAPWDVYDLRQDLREVEGA